MKLSLSTTAASQASPRELFAACTRRGLVALELYDPGDDAPLEVTEAEELTASARALGIDICGLYRPRLHTEEVVDVARLAAALNAPAVVPIWGFDRSLLERTAEHFASVGARLLLAHGSDPRTVEAIRWLVEPLAQTAAIGLAWEIRPGADDPAKLPDVLEAAGDELQYVRLYGGGPEAHAQAGMGIGSVMGRLTLARFAGPLVLTPSDPRYHQAWSAWLGRGGGWGCGSKQAGPVTLYMDAPAGRALELR